MSESGQFRDLGQNILDKLTSPKVTLDLERIAREVDPTGLLNIKLVRPLHMGEIRALEAAELFAKQWARKFPSLGIGTEGSAILQRFVEGRVKPGDNVTRTIKRAAREMRNIYNKKLMQINAVRQSIGKDPIAFRKDFATHFRELGVLDNFFGSVINIPREMEKAAIFGKPLSPFFRSELQRLGGEFTDDAVGGLFRYISVAGS